MHLEMRLFRSKELKNKNLRAIENTIVRYVKKHQPVYMGEIIKYMKMSPNGGGKYIMGLLNEGRLKYSKDSPRIVK
jgi:hypothetical protein